MELSNILTKSKLALQLLNQAAYNTMRFKYPLIQSELLPRPKYSDKTIKGLTSCIIAYLRYKGNQAERISVTGRRIDQRKTYADVLGNSRQIGSFKWIPSSMQTSTSDISATIKGRSIKIEVKVGGDKQRPAQVEYQKKIEAAGGLYVIANSFQQFYEWYQLTLK
ncbi:MAG: hypothetical protein M0Q38_09930 [Bacteroidales bacterium]|jgi:hypothetical protein|nr:hypothetical protein [Bacteroidales bacterium]